MRKRKMLFACALCAAVTAGAAACGNTTQDGSNPDSSTEVQTETQTETETAADSAEEVPADLDFTVNYDGIATAKIEAGASVHDPSIVKVDGKYYIFGSHMSTAVSDDLRSPKSCL